MHVVAALLFSLIALSALGLVVQTLLTQRDRIVAALANPAPSADPGYAWVARVRRVARPAPTLARFRPLPQVRPAPAHA